MKATLIVVEGAKPARVPLQLPTTIGRSERAKLKLRASLVSRTHCELYQDGDELKIRDLGSSNGTKVNGDRIVRPTSLVTDDLIQIGPVILRVICDRQDSIADAEPMPPDIVADPDANPTTPESIENEAVADADSKTAQPESQFQLEAPVESHVESHVEPRVEPRAEPRVEATSKGVAEFVDAEVVEDMPDMPLAVADTPTSDAGNIEPDDDVILAEPVEDEEASSEPPVVVTYEANDEGSVIHIEEAADFLRHLETDTPEAGDSVLDDLHDVEPDPVESGDSKLDNFFNNLD